MARRVSSLLRSAKVGYDEFFGNMSGAVDHFTHHDMTDILDLFEDEVPVEKSDIWPICSPAEP